MLVCRINVVVCDILNKWGLFFTFVISWGYLKMKADWNFHCEYLSIVNELLDNNSASNMEEEAIKGFPLVLSSFFIGVM